MYCALISEDMASLNEKDRDWFSGKIQAAITSLQTSEWVKTQIVDAVDELRPKPWRRAVDNIVAVGTPVAIGSLIVALLSLAAGAIYVATAHVKEETEFRKGTSDELKAIHIEVVGSRALISANQPLKKQNQNAAKELLAQARDKGIPAIPVTALEQAGDSFIEASGESSEAWGVALGFVSYRTSLNGDVHTAKIAQELAKTPFAPNLASKYYNFKTPPPGAFPLPYITLGGDVPIDQAAIVKDADLPQPPNPVRAYEVVLIVGGAITLDHMIMKHVVIRGSKVFYSGDSLDLTEVVFVDCNFQLVNSVNARALANAVLAQAEVPFKAP